MSKVRRIDFYPDDFLVGVAGMRPDDIGVYWVICSLMYSSGTSSVRRDDPRLRCIVNSRWDRVQRCIERLVAAGKLSESGHELASKRSWSELERASKRIQSAHENGSKGGRPKALAKPGGSFSEKLSIINQQPSSNAGGNPPPVVPLNLTAVIFGDCANYLVQQGRTIEQAKSLLGSWRSDYEDRDIVDVIMQTQKRPDIQSPVPYIVAALKKRSRKGGSARVVGEL